MRELKTKKHIFLIFLFSSFLLQLRSQCLPPQTRRAVPFMWVPKEKSVERKLWFKFGKLPTSLYTKQEILNNATSNKKHAPNYIYSTADFDQLIQMIEDDAQTQHKTVTGLRIYFGAHNISYEPDGGYINPNIIPDKQIVLIFAPTDASATDIGSFYFFGSDQKPHQFRRSVPPQGSTVDIKTDWLTNYRVNEAEAGLASTLEPNAGENEYGGKPTDTKSILYCYVDFKDFMKCERDYQNVLRQAEQKPPIDSIEIDFASYSDAGVERGQHPLWFKNRLHIIFEFKSHGAIVNIDETKDFYDRLTTLGVAPTNCNIPAFTKGNDKGGDNGQLCPPYNCPR